LHASRGSSTQTVPAGHRLPARPPHVPVALAQMPSHAAPLHFALRTQTNPAGHDRGQSLPQPIAATSASSNATSDARPTTVV
jgi:hypothetical protein